MGCGTMPGGITMLGGTIPASNISVTEQTTENHVMANVFNFLSIIRATTNYWRPKLEIRFLSGRFEVNGLVHEAVW